MIEPQLRLGNSPIFFKTIWTFVQKLLNTIFQWTLVFRFLLVLFFVIIFIGTYGISCLFFRCLFNRKITCHLSKVNKVNTEWVSYWIDAQSSCLGFTSFNVRPCLYTKTADKYCCGIRTILCMIFKKLLFIKSLCRPLLTKYMRILNHYYHFKIMHNE